MEAILNHWNTSLFSVRGRFWFRMSDDSGDKVQTICDTLAEVDQEFPWEPYPESPGAVGSIEIRGQFLRHRIEPGNVYSCTIQPYRGMPSSRLFAYNKYLCSLAKQIALRGLPGLDSVEVEILVEGGKTQYLTPVGEQNLRAQQAETVRRLIAETQ
jgi:hypothetical protein